MSVLVTGSEGFIGSNLLVRLKEIGCTDIDCITRSTTTEQLRSMISKADFVFHLAGVNRPKSENDFTVGNVQFSSVLCDELHRSKRQVPVVMSSSTQAELPNAYGKSKLEAEKAVRKYGDLSGACVRIYRLPNVFGKWARPNYNSAVATFCYNTIHDLPVSVHNGAAELSLLYIDDLLDLFIGNLNGAGSSEGDFESIPKVYQTTVGEVARTIASFKASRTSLVIPPVGSGLVRALYSTYVSYLPPDMFSYSVPRYSDPRGTFAEILRTESSGQFSYFTAGPGITRGEHYHHTKTEKFFVISGKALFRFRNIDTGVYYELAVEGGEGRVVETVPGWAHDITNVGHDEMIVILWANELFDRAKPDTVSMKVVK